MTLPTVLLVSLALGTDALSLAIGIGLSGIAGRQIALISGTVSLFHVFMPLIGLTLGSLLDKAVGQLASYIGAGVLIFIGLQMLKEGVGGDREPSPLGKKGTVYTGLGGLAVLAASVSLDALTVGFGLGTLRAGLAVTVLIMGAVAGLMTAAGFLLGSRMGSWLGEKAQAVGGLILILIGIKMFF